MCIKVVFLLCFLSVMSNDNVRGVVSSSSTIRYFFKLLLLFWRTRCAILAYFQVIFLIVLIFVIVYLKKSFNNFYKDFWDAMQNYDIGGIIASFKVFIALASLWVVTIVFSDFVNMRLVLRWRVWLNNYFVGKYIDNNNYLKFNSCAVLDNPDQRISEDIPQFIDTTLRFTLGSLRTLGTLITFCIILWNLSSATDITLLGRNVHLPNGYCLYLILLYSVIGNFVTFFIGKPLPKLNFDQQHFEANYRYSLVRFRENAESIAVYKGEKTELLYLDRLFNYIFVNKKKLIHNAVVLDSFTLGWGQTQIFFHVAICLPLYFSKKIAIGGIQQMISAFSSVYDCMSYIMENFQLFASWKATINRLGVFDETLENFKYLKNDCNLKHCGSNLILSCVNVFKPNGEQLIRGLNLEIGHGDSLLIKGKSGCGKSTLIKTMAGIWPYASGDIQLPSTDNILFMSQRNYMPLGTLRSSICYPRKIIDYDNGVFVELMEYVGLQYLIGKLDVVDRWSDVLSLGEQQRIAFLRIFLIKPDVVFLDETTSSVDEDCEIDLYKKLKEILGNSIIVSVGHRSTLDKFHNKVITL